MQGQAVRESALSDLMSSCSTLATPIHEVNLSAGGPPAGGGGGRVAGGVPSRGVSKRVSFAPVRCGLSHVIAWSSDRVVEWSSSHVVAWVRVMWSRGFESCGRVGLSHVVAWVRVMWSRGSSVAWSYGRVL